MSFDLNSVLNINAALDIPFFPEEPPPQDPPSIRDIEMSPHPHDMSLHMQDPCPVCGAFNMRLGDWVCQGCCCPCFNSFQEGRE